MNWWKKMSNPPHAGLYNGRDRLNVNNSLQQRAMGWELDWWKGLWGLFYRALRASGELPSREGTGFAVEHSGVRGATRFGTTRFFGTTWCDVMCGQWLGWWQCCTLTTEPSSAPIEYIHHWIMSNSTYGVVGEEGRQKCFNGHYLFFNTLIQITPWDFSSNFPSTSKNTGPNNRMWWK